MPALRVTSGAVEAALSPTAPGLLSLNELSGAGVSIPRVLDLSDKTHHDSDLSVSYEVTSGPNWAKYAATARLNEREAARYVIRFLTQEDRLTVTCEFGKEPPGFELMSVTVPLISAGEQDGSLVLPFKGGRLVDIGASEPGEFVQRATCDSMPLVAMLAQGKTAAMVELGSLDDNIISAISQTDNGKHAALSARFTHRYGPRNRELPAFPVTNRSEAFITLFERSGKHWWTQGAKRLRERVLTSIPPLYDGAVIYKIKLDEPQFTEDEFMTFDDAIDRIRRIHNLTGGAPQIAYLNGWQHSGHDTGYPDVFTVNQRAGGIEGMRRAIEAGPSLNAVVSFHDNYDDAYTNSPAWEDEIIATDENGKPKAGGVWGGGQAYIISPHKYIDRARERIRKTVEMTGISGTIHVDVLSVVPDRYDFDPANPAGFARSAEAKNYIIRGFRELGIDVTSEGICSAFVGNVNYGWHFPDGEEHVFSSEEIIPLLPFIYHGRVIGAGGIDSDRHLLKHLLWGLGFCDSIRKHTDLAKFIDLYYLVYVPFFQLASRVMCSYESEGSAARVTYEDGSYVRVDFDANSYEIVADGVTIAKDFTTTAPMPPCHPERSRRICFSGWCAYSRDGGELAVPLPDPGAVRGVLALTQDGPAPTRSWRIDERGLVIEATPETPYRIEC